MTKRHDRFIEQSTNVVVVILAQFVNFILLIGGLTSLWGIYSVLLFGFLIYLYDLIRYALTHYGGTTADSRIKCTGGGEPTTHVHGPPTHNEIRVFVGVWLVWWAVTQFFYEAGLQLSLSWILLPFLFLCVLAVSVAPQSIACDVFPLLFIITLALPSQEWMPQYMAWTRDVLRVFAYFVAVFVADFFVERNMLSEQAVIDAATPEILTRRKQHNDDASASTSEQSFSQTTIYFCVVVERYESIFVAEQRRIKAIVAISAWVLIVPKLMIVLFSIGLLVVHGLLFWQRRRAAATLIKQPQQPQQPQVALNVTHDIETQPLNNTQNDDDDDDDASASASEDQTPPAYIPPPAPKRQRRHQSPQQHQQPPPPAARIPTTFGGGVRTKIISINRQ